MKYDLTIYFTNMKEYGRLNSKDATYKIEEFKSKIRRFYGLDFNSIEFKISYKYYCTLEELYEALEKGNVIIEN